MKEPQGLPGFPPESTSSTLGNSSHGDDTQNVYFVWPRHQEPIRLSLDACHQDLDGALSYLTKALKILERSYGCSGLTFYLTYDTMRELPIYGSNVVVVVYGDESGRMPTFRGKVGLVFKCYGSRPVFCDRIRPSYLAFLAALQFARNFVSWLPGWVRYQMNKRVGPDSTPIYTIPLGYLKQQDLPLKKFGDRRLMMSFIGSIHQHEYHRLSVKRVLGTPKEISRRRMLIELLKIKEQRQENDIHFGFTKDYHDSRREEGLNYSAIMQDTKICLVPRGTSYETFRFFEAMRYGCVVVCEALPKHWFYEGSPAIRVRDWNELTQILSYYEHNPRELQRLHEETVAWWDQKCSERALAAFMAAALRDRCGDPKRWTDDSLK